MKKTDDLQSQLRLLQQESLSFHRHLEQRENTFLIQIKELEEDVLTKCQRVEKLENDIHTLHDSFKLQSQKLLSFETTIANFESKEMKLLKEQQRLENLLQEKTTELHTVEVITSGYLF